MHSKTSFKPDWASPPGETVAAVLHERRVSFGDFSAMLGRSEQTVDELLSGELRITDDIAELLSAALGGSKDFWCAREAHFRAAVEQLEDQVGDAKAEEWIKSLPFRDMANLGWVRPTRKRRERMSECLRFFGVPDFESWERQFNPILQSVAMRTSPSFESNPASVATWFRKGEIEASRLNTADWSSSVFEASLTDIRSLTRESDPAKFLPTLVNTCAASGVSVVVLRPPDGCRASGAARFLAGDRPLIMLSGRHLSEDHFWFTFFHEAAHLILHGEQELFLDFDSSPSSTEECEANSFAQDILIPQSYKSEFLNLGRGLRDIVRFSRKIGVSTGVVVGQLQHCEVLKPNRLNRAKRRYSWDCDRLVEKR